MALQTINALTSYFERIFYDDISKIKASTGFLSRFGRPETGAVTTRVNDALEFSMDIVRNKKKINSIYPRSHAEAMTNLGSNQKVTTGQIFENVARDFPIMRSASYVSYDDTFKRLPGELGVTDVPGNDGATAFMKAAVNLARDVRVNMVQDVGRLELMAAEAIRTGVITLDDGTAYNFGRSTSNTDTVAITWDNQDTAIPFANLSAHYTTVRRNGKGDPRVVVMSGNSFNAFLETDEVKSSADNRDISFVRAGDPGSLSQLPTANFVADLEANGFSYMAYYKDLKTGRKMYIFVYDEDYQDGSDTWVRYMPDDKVLFFDDMIRLDRFFGPRIRFDYQTPEEQMINRLFGIDAVKAAMPDTLGNGVVESWMWHHDTFSNGQKTSIGIESYINPLLAPTEVDGAGELTVL